MKHARAVGFLVVLMIMAMLGVTTPLAALEVGDKAPVFTLPATVQDKFALGDVIGKKNVVLFGFIGAFTPT